MKRCALCPGIRYSTKASPYGGHTNYWRYCMFKFIDLNGWHINICHVTVFHYESGSLQIWTSESVDSLVISDPDKVWYASLCEAVENHPV